MKQNIAILINSDIDRPNNYDKCNFSDIDSLDNQSCENIYIGDLLDYIVPNDLESTISKIISKAQIGGQLHIKAPDILQLSWYVSRLNLSLTKFRYVVYDTGRASCYSMDEILTVLAQEKNLRIVSATYTNGYEYAITARINE